MCTYVSAKCCTYVSSTVCTYVSAEFCTYVSAELCTYLSVELVDPILLMCTSINLEHFVRSLTFDGIVHFAYVCQGVANMNLCPILAHPVFDQGVRRQIETNGACDLVHCTLQVSDARRF